MKTLKDIFDKASLETFDWFGFTKNDCKFYPDCITFCEYSITSDKSIADLLANKSWCKALWGEVTTYKVFIDGEYNNDISASEYNGYSNEEFWKTYAKKDGYKTLSLEAFQLLQQEGEQEAIDFIYNTIKK